MWPIALIFVYCSLVAAASLVGGWLPSLLKLTHTGMQLTMCFVGGLMLGVALLHLLPHAAVQMESLDRACEAAVCGLLAMFLMIRVFEVHGHEPHEDVLHHGDGEYGGDEQHQPSSHRSPRHVSEMSWLGLFVGLAIHSLIDGMALAASVMVGQSVPWPAGLIGLGTFVAVLLHKPLDAIPILSVMVAAGWSRSWRRVVNVAFALMCPLGALSFFLGVRELGAAGSTVVGLALGFSAGAFLCIALADLLPELQFHRHDRLKLTIALVAGMVMGWAIRYVEPAHVHQGPVHHEYDHRPGSGQVTAHDEGARTTVPPDSRL